LSCPVSALELSTLKGLAAGLHWNASQFIQTDGKGNVFLMRGDNLKVYPVTKDHDLGEPEQLLLQGIAGPLRDAALSHRGDWALLLGRDVRLVVDGQEKPLGEVAPWFPISVGFIRNDPTTTVTFRFDEVAAGDKRGAPPVVLRAVQNGWSAEVREAEAEAHDINVEMAKRPGFVLTEKQDRYFLARQYAYRIELRRLGRPGPLEELRLGKGEIQFRRQGEGDERRVVAAAEKEGAHAHGASVGAFLGVPAIRGIVHGSTGQLYVLVAPEAAGGGNCALDRVDWAAQQVERTQLSKSLRCDGRVSLAAGRDGLYFAPFHGQSDRYFASWSDIDAADWRGVAEMRFEPSLSADEN
jgi:hypothetical protein